VSPTAETAVANLLEHVEIKPASPPHAGASRVFTATAVFDGQRWSALCLELDIAADGDSAGEAFENLRRAVQEAIEVAAERGISAGTPAPEADVLAFLQTHRTYEQPVMGQQFVV